MATAIRNAAADSYMGLIAEFPLRRIKTSTDHAKATRLVLRLSAQRVDRGTLDYLDVLVDLIADYEQRLGYAGNAKLSAVELVRHRIAERGVSVSALARSIGVPQSNLSEMLGAKRDWSETAIRGLCFYLNIRAERFPG